MVKDPIIKSPIKTDIPIKTLLVPLINLLITPMKITNPRKIKKETKVLPEKKLSAIKDTNINIKRSDEAIKTEAKIVAVSCPFCNTMMNDGMTSKQESVDVVDIAQMIEKAEDL